MGMIVHNAIMVTECSESCMEKAYTKAKEIFGDLCSEIINSPFNGYQSFFIAPDGSKEGWEDSDIFDRKRGDFFEWWTEQGLSGDVVELTYGNSDFKPYVSF